MIDTLTIWTKYNPDEGHPDSSEGYEWRWGAKEQSSITVDYVRIFVDQEAEDLDDNPEERGRIRAEINVPALLRVWTPDLVGDAFLELPKALKKVFDYCWAGGGYPPFVNWRVSRMDVSLDYFLGADVDIQEVLVLLRQVEAPDFVPITYGNRGHITVSWKTQGYKGRPSKSPDVIRMYEKRQELEDTGAPQEVAEAFRGVLRMEYQVRHSNGIMQSVLGRDRGAPVYVHEIVNPLMTSRIMRRARKLLGLQKLSVGTLDALGVLREKFGAKKARNLYKHYTWIMMRGLDDWQREHSQPTYSRTRAELEEAGLWPVLARPVEINLEEPTIPALAGDNWRKKFKPR